MRTLFLRLGWLAVLLAVAAFFIPWVKLQVAPFNRVAEREQLVNQLNGAASASWGATYFSLRDEDSRVAFDKPLNGESAMNLISMSHSAQPLDQQMIQQISESFNVGSSGNTVLIIYLLPALTVLGMVLYTIAFGSRTILLLTGLISAGVYFLARYSLDASFLDRTVRGVVPGLGLWITLYCLLLVAFFLLLGALLPIGKR
ncbi:MAG: hypothetical protein PW734_12485 [Verrucomicrobium sp.]|nr:hypothetical protein [Verrucomicrobium sp.]